MRTTDAFAALRKSRLDIFREAEAGGLWRLEPRTTRRKLFELSQAGLIEPLGNGWWTVGEVSLYRAVERVCEPHAAYVSLLSALFLHGMIEQIPTTTYAVTTGPSRRLKTRRGQISFHHVAAEYFGGYSRSSDGFLLATPEKALVDTAYLSGTKTRRFVRLPEVELPEEFSAAKCRGWVQRIPSPRLQAMAERRLERFLPLAIE